MPAVKAMLRQQCRVAAAGCLAAGQLPLRSYPSDDSWQLVLGCCACLLADAKLCKPRWKCFPCWQLGGATHGVSCSCLLDEWVDTWYAMRISTALL
jgi:hypothetical protein